MTGSTWTQRFPERWIEFYCCVCGRFTPEGAIFRPCCHAEAARVNALHVEPLRLLIGEAFP